MRLSSARVFFTAVFFALPWLTYAQAPAASPGNQPATAEMSQSPVPAISKQDATTSPSVRVEPTRPSDAKSREAIAPTATPTIGMHELSPWSMFLNADIIVKIVMCGLAFASLMTWTVLIAKTTELLNSRRSLKASLKRILTAGSLNEAQELVGSKPNVLAGFLSAAMLEADLSRAVGAGKEDGVKERVASSFAEITRNEGRSVRRGMGLLATIGSTSPFVGLFGTVWGIMNSFIGISKSQTTNLAVVAPGIAEALLATAIGLVAAIPAVIIYNHFSRQMRAYLDVVAQASGAAGRLLSRDLDSRRETTFRQAAE